MHGQLDIGAASQMAKLLEAEEDIRENHLDIPPVVIRVYYTEGIQSLTTSTT